MAVLLHPPPPPPPPPPLPSPSGSVSPRAGALARGEPAREANLNTAMRLSLIHGWLRACACSHNNYPKNPPHPHSSLFPLLSAPSLTLSHPSLSHPCSPSSIPVVPSHTHTLALTTTTTPTLPAHSSSSSPPPASNGTVPLPSSQPLLSEERDDDTWHGTPFMSPRSFPPPPFLPALAVVAFLPRTILVVCYCAQSWFEHVSVVAAI